MSDFNNTYIYFNLPKNIYLCKFQKFVNNILFSYYKDYVYKAQLYYPFYEEIPSPAGGSYFEEFYDPIQLKFILTLNKKFMDYWNGKKQSN